MSCRVYARFHVRGAAVTESIPCRWSDRPEPIRTDLVDPVTLGAPPGQPVLVGLPDPTLLPASQTLDLPAGSRWEEVAVAVLVDGEAYGWGAESYFHQWKNPAWKLARGTYDVEIRVEWQGKSKTGWYTLEYNSADLKSFTLTDRSPA